MLSCQIAHYFFFFSGTLVPSTFLCTLMFLQTSFLVLGSVWHTRRVSPAAIVPVANTTAMTVNNVFILYPYKAGNDCAGPNGLPPKFGAGAPKLGAGAPNAPGLPKAVLVLLLTKALLVPKLVGAWLVLFTLTMPWLFGGMYVVPAPGPNPSCKPPFSAPAIFSLVRPYAAIPNTAPMAI